MTQQLKHTANRKSKDWFAGFLNAAKERVEQNNGQRGIILNAQNEPKLRWIVTYFSKKKTNTTGGIDRSKGLLIVGPIGSFKTTTLKIIQKGLKPGYRFSLVPTRDVVSGFNRTDKNDQGRGYGGENSLERYSQRKEYAFDDIGAEREGSHYGNKMNVMEHIINIRYDLWVEHGIRTHFTSNIPLIDKNGGKDLRSVLGKRDFDRLEQMVHQVVLPDGTGMRDKSKPTPLLKPLPPDNIDPQFLNMPPLTPERRAQILAETSAKMQEISYRVKRGGSKRHEQQNKEQFDVGFWKYQSLRRVPNSSAEDCEALIRSCETYSKKFGQDLSAIVSACENRIKELQNTPEQ